MAKPSEAGSGDDPGSNQPRPLYASSHDDVNVGPEISEKDVNVVESYFPGLMDRGSSMLSLNSGKRRTMMSERSDRFSYLSVQDSQPGLAEFKQNALPPLLVAFACLVAAFLGLVVAGLHDMIKYVGCPLGINGCNSFSGESYEKKAYLLLKVFEDLLPDDVVFVLMAILCCLTIGIIADVVPESISKQILGGGTVQSLLAVAAGVPIPFKCAVLRVVVTAIYFLGGGTQGGDGPTIQVCTALSCMIGWVCGIRAPRTQSLLASLGFCCGFASSFNAPLSGILFAMEELSHVSSRLTTRVICIILIGSIVSTAVMRGFLGNKTLFKAKHSIELEGMVSGGSMNQLLGQDLWMLISVIIGFLAALVGFMFSRLFHYVHKLMDWMSLPRWILFGIVGGLVAGIGSGVYHITGLRGVWGIGVNSLKMALEQDFQGHAGYLLTFALGKLLAFNFSVAARFPGDTLEPVLIAGAFLGGAIGKHLPVEVVGESNSPCVIFGMVGLFASCFRFALTPVVIVLELTGTRTYNIILPVAMSSFTALAVSNHLFPPILEQILHQDSIDLEAVAELAEVAEEEEEMMQAQMGRTASISSLNVSEASGISVASKGPLSGLVTRLEDSMMDVSSRRRRISQISLASSRSGGRRGSHGHHGPSGRGIRRLSMNSRMSAASRASQSSRTGTCGTGSRSLSPPKRNSVQDQLRLSPGQSPRQSPAISYPSPRESPAAELTITEEPELEDEVPADRPKNDPEMEEVHTDEAACCAPFAK